MDSRIEEILKEKVGDEYEEVPLMSRIEILLDRLGSGSGDSSEYAHSLELTINSETYVVTATLKNTDGDTLGTPQTIDLPLETMVVNGTYDNTTKKVILKLKNGNTVDFSVADLVDGLQTEITSSNKLNSDLVDDTNQNNKFVTAVEKEKINNALVEEVYNAGKQVKTGSNIGEIFNNYVYNVASGNSSHAEGYSTIASGNSSHAEGYATNVSGNNSHAEGSYTIVSGDSSHAEGSSTIASGTAQHVQGKWNREDSNSKYAFIIGNGTNSNRRSNAFAIDWNGLIYVNNSATGVNVSQLQPIINSTNKLSADLVDDSNSTNKFTTEIETIDLIHDKTEDKYYFPAEKRYILEERKPFLSGIWYDSTHYLEMCAFSSSNIYDDGQGNIDGTYTYQFGAAVDINEGSRTFDYYTMVIDVRTLEITINNYNVDNNTETFLLGAETGVTVGGLPIYTRIYDTLTDSIYDSYYFDVSLIIQGTFQNGDTIAVAWKSIGTAIIPAILYRNNEYSAINLFLLGTDSMTYSNLKTFSNLESGDKIYVNHTIHKVTHN